MCRFTVQVSDAQHAHLRALAQSRGTNFESTDCRVTTRMLALNEKTHDAEVRLRLRAAKGLGKTATYEL